MRRSQHFAMTTAAGLPRSASVAVPIAAVLLLPLVLAASGQEWQRLIMLLLVAPVLEETVFRAGVHEALRRHWRTTPHLANAATALAFGVAHALLRADPAAFAVAVPALLIGAVYERTGRLRECIALHAAMNAAWLAWHMARTGPSLW